MPWSGPLGVPIPLARSSREPTDEEALIFDSTPASEWPSILGSTALVDLDRASKVWDELLDVLSKYPDVFTPELP
jgi:hypothetical protein